jgi:hypothetical protein
MKIIHDGLLEDILLPDSENIQFVPGASKPARHASAILSEVGDGYIVFSMNFRNENS